MPIVELAIFLVTWHIFLHFKGNLSETEVTFRHLKNISRNCQILTIFWPFSGIWEIARPGGPGLCSYLTHFHILEYVSELCALHLDL